MTASAPLDATFAALADPTRRAIVARLRRGEATVLELAAPFDVSLPAISRHLKVLERAGIIGRSRRGPHRPCHLRPDAFVEAADWLESARAEWSARLDRLDAFLLATHRSQGDPDDLSREP